MAFNLSFQHSHGDHRSLSLDVGGVMFMLGANGSGKSSLMHKFYVDNVGVSRRITAHRQTWFASNTMDMTASGKRNTELHLTQADRSPDSRWKDDYSAQRSTITIFDLIDAENIRARSIAKAFDNNDMAEATAVSHTEAPIKLINELMKQANLPIEIGIEGGEEVTARKASSSPFSIAQLSDGERNALLIVASVLTAKPGSLILIDEPERHLHRSIISPLLTLLFAKRKDCGFVISTHDIGLPLDNKQSVTLLVRSCAYQNKTVSSWDAELVPAEGGIDEDIRIDIIGARKKIIFIEGKTTSLDQPLYNLIFPDVSIIAKESCKSVEHFVTSIRESASLHWMSAWGIVDNDSRLPEDCDGLQRKGVYALAYHSVEAIYYHPEIIKRIADRQVVLTGGDSTSMTAAALAAAIAGIAPHKMRLSARVSENRIRGEVFKCLPTHKSISDGTPINVVIDVQSIVQLEQSRFEDAVQRSDVLGLMARYPIRETPALGAIVACLKFKDRETYESAVRKMIADDQEALDFVRALFTSLINDMQTQPGTTAISLS